ncbi:alpha-amylase family glycosyl hydrolase [Deinococcus sonorensis]|uniref:Alpha-amylase family glycosyl hydrolase n=2 Tax=Deinococcus sonorensis TaxID=309891 RepID=A0AAU7UC37_9DEIO
MTVYTDLPAQHDHTPSYTAHLGQPTGALVPIRLRTTLPVTQVSVKLVRVGEIETHPAEEVPAPANETRPGRWFEFLLPVHSAAVRYSWLLELPDDHLNLTMSGLHHVRRPFRDWFQYLSGYQAPEWAWESVFYQIFPDRFRNGDPSVSVQTGEYQYNGRDVFQVPWTTAPDWNGDIHGHYGGDLSGITEQLPYLTELGINALWLTPIFESPSNHRYDITDYRRIDPHLGGQAAFDRLIGAAAQQGVRVVLDGVFNHVGNENALFKAALASEDAPERSMFTWRSDHPLPYHAFFDVPTLPKIDYASLEARNEFWDGEEGVVRHWLRQGIAGWRLDVAHMMGVNGTDDDNLDLHRALKTAAREERADAYVFGERFFDPERALQGGGEDGAMNYHGFGLPVMQWLSGQSYTLRPSRLNGGEVVELLWDAYHALPPQMALNMFNLLDSHDVPRALYRLGQDRVRLRAAVTLLMGYPGVPCLYYGTEIGLSQTEPAAMPFCRAPMPWPDQGGTPDQWDDRLRQDVQRLIRLRRETPALQRGSLRFLLAEDDAIGYVRELDGVRVAVLASRDSRETPTTLTLPDGDWRDALSGEPVGSGTVQLRLAGGRVLIQS